MTEVLDKTAVAPAMPFAVGDRAYLIYDPFTEDERIKQTVITDIYDLFGQTNVVTDQMVRPFARVLTEDRMTGEIHQKFLTSYASHKTVLLCAASDVRDYWIEQELRKDLQALVDDLAIKHQSSGVTRIPRKPDVLLQYIDSIRNRLLNRMAPE